MTAPATRSLGAPVPRNPFVELAVVATVLFGLMVLWSGFDARVLDTATEVWVKPAKFAVSFIVHFGTLAVFVALASPEARSSRWITLSFWAMGTAFLVEMGYMIVQGAQAEQSHFNLSTPFHSAMYSVMGIGAVTLITLPLLVVRAVVRDGAARLGPVTRQGLWLGAVLSFVLTLVTAGYMSTNSSALVGVPSEGAPVLPILGWSAEVGDMRPAHFLALHGLQALPLAGWWIDRRGGGPRALILFAGLWTALTAAVFVQAILGLPLIRL